MAGDRRHRLGGEPRGTAAPAAQSGAPNPDGDTCSVSSGFDTEPGRAADAGRPPPDGSPALRRDPAARLAAFVESVSAEPEAAKHLARPGRTRPGAGVDAQSWTILALQAGSHGFELFGASRTLQDRVEEIVKVVTDGSYAERDLWLLWAGGSRPGQGKKARVPVGRL